jgi:hypothetical protein
MTYSPRKQEGRKILLVDYRMLDTEGKINQISENHLCHTENKARLNVRHVCENQGKDSNFVLGNHRRMVAANEVDPNIHYMYLI